MMKLSCLICICATAIALCAGCASPPKRQAPDLDLVVPSSWTAPEDGVSEWPSDPSWWTSFDDERLDELIREAIENNYSLKAAVARVDAAEASARLAGAQGLPNLSAGMNASRRKQNLIGIPIPGAGDIISTRTTSYGVSLDLSWELDLWGRVRSAKSAALADLEASAADLAGLRLSVAAQTAKACFALVESRQQVDLASETVESYRLSAEQVRDRYKQGVRTSLDLRLAMSSLYAAEALLENRIEGYDRTKRQFEILLGRYPAAAIEGFSELPEVAGAVPQGLPSELLIRRPDLYAAERRYAAAEKRVSEARRAFFPSINLTGSAGTLTQQLEDLVSGDFNVWSIATGVTQPLFQGGRLRANLALSHALADQALANYAQALLTGFAEVESALFAEQSLARREDKLARSAEQSEAARVLAERQYNSGIVDYITVLETQRRALNSQSELISVRRQRLDARVNLHLALGGGFELTDNWTQFLEKPGDSKTEAPVE
jgi:multidrug efflux system outer membrane protein